MKKLLLALSIVLMSFPALANADSDDDQGVIKTVDKDHGTITLDNGKVYNTPSEFNFDGLQPGVKVVIYYTTTNGKRIVDDLQTE